ncbi:MAG: type II toxin-antitoxin system HicA family toxin [Candidatus Liptonbacteria bacterium]|nr:type II toxin-antitoxin system HicA family toxin [Candidatus Liptonbacteria bacterium]
MARTFSGKEVVKVLVREFEFRVVSQRGSHVKLKKMAGGGVRIIVVPLHRELALGTLRGVLDLAEVNYDEFLEKA